MIKKSEYRVCSRPSVPGLGLQIHEVFFDEKNRICLYSKDPVSPYGDTIDELYESYYQLWRAIEDHEVHDLDRLDKKLSIRKSSDQ